MEPIELEVRLPDQITSSTILVRLHLLLERLQDVLLHSDKFSVKILHFSHSPIQRTQKKEFCQNRQNVNPA